MNAISLKGSELSLGNQPQVELELNMEGLGYQVRRIQQEYPGGCWRSCLHRGYIAMVYERGDDEILWLIRLEMDVPTQPKARLLAVPLHTVAFIKDPGNE